jgi:hypothetical protein
MPLLFCPECGHEISQNAVACPNCGRPLQTTPPVVEKKVVIPPPVERRDQFPPWVWIPIGAAGLLLILVLYLLMRNPNQDANVNVAVNARRTNSATTTRTSVPSTDTQTVTVPGSETTVPSTTTGAPVAPPTTGTVIINARVMSPRASAPSPARSTKFYLLDKDIDSVLGDAGVDPIEGNDLAASLGLAAVYPDRYGAFQRAAMRAIAAKAKYTVTTDASGKADLANIAPDQYYLFAVQRIGNGFVLWNAPVSVISGQNVLNLSPQNVTEVTDASG